jgi:hypothetical protein
MYSPEDGLPDPICRNCKWHGYNNWCLVCDDKKIDQTFGGRNCEAHEYCEPEQLGKDDRYEKGEK